MAINEKANELLERLESKLREQLLSIRIDRKDLEDFLKYAMPKPQPEKVDSQNSTSLLQSLSSVKEGTSQKETIHLMFKEISKRVRGCGLILLGAGSPYIWPGPKFGLPVGERIGSRRINIELGDNSDVNKVATTGEMMIIDNLSDSEKKIYHALDITYPSSLALIPMTINGRIQAVAMADVDEGTIDDPAALAVISGVACSVIEHLPFRERIGFSQFPRFRDKNGTLTATAQKEQVADPFPEPETVKQEIAKPATPKKAAPKPPVEAAPAPKPAPAPPKPEPKPEPVVAAQPPAPKPEPKPAPAPAPKPEPVVIEEPPAPEPEPAPPVIAEPPAPEPEPVEIELSSTKKEPVTFQSQTLDTEPEEEKATAIELDNMDAPDVEFTFDSEEKKADALDEYELPEISNEDVADLMPTNLKTSKKAAPVSEPEPAPVEEPEIELLDSPEPYDDTSSEIDIDISDSTPEPELTTSKFNAMPEKTAVPAPEPEPEPELQAEAPSYELEEGQDPDSINTEVVPAEDPDSSMNSDILKYENLGLQGYSLDHLSGDERRKHQKAIRFARLLVSEIKLYNEEQVKVGKEKADIMNRLKEDIERSQVLYNQRIAEDVRSNSDYFKAEMVRQLCDGDTSLLGA